MELEIIEGKRADGESGVRLIPVKIERYPVWDVWRIESDEPPPETNELDIAGHMWHRVNLPGGLFVVPDRKQQWEVNMSLAVEASR
jgi:hypothetical protein